jgi:hypothetical protein
MTKLDTLTDTQWQQVHAARADWLATGLSTTPANCPTAETAITEMYRLIGKPTPQFVWVDSPPAAALAIWLFDGLAGKSTKGQLRGQLWDQLWDQLRGQLWDQLGGQLPEAAWSYFSTYYDIGWIAFYHVPHTMGIVTYDPEVLRRLTLWVDIARSANMWWPFEGICVMSERPSVVHTEPWVGREPGMVRLHCEDGPSIQYRDGWTVHTWHGTRVPADLIEGEGWSTEQILKETNQEIRRCAIERIGWDQFIDRAELHQVGDPAADPGNPGNTITLYELPDQLYDEPVRVLLCTNGTVERDGTRRRFGLTVPAEIDDPIAAAAWTYNWPTAAYRKLARRA